MCTVLCLSLRTVLHLLFDFISLCVSIFSSTELSALNALSAINATVHLHAQYSCSKCKVLFIYVHSILFIYTHGPLFIHIHSLTLVSVTYLGMLVIKDQVGSYRKYPQQSTWRHEDGRSCWRSREKPASTDYFGKLVCPETALLNEE